MMKFESDLAPSTELPYGTPDQLDEWLESDAEMEERLEAWGDWQELTFDPDA